MKHSLLNPFSKTVMQPAAKTDHGLSDRELDILRNVLKLYHPKIERVGIFGSRANGKFKPYSDIDLVLFGNLQEQDVARIYTLLDDSSLGLSIDVLSYLHITYPPLKRHIDENTKQLFSSSEIEAA